MKDEIKEILDMLKDSKYIPSDDNRTYKLLDRDDTRHLLDYITNLQEKLDKQSKNSYECGYKAGLIQAEIDNTMGVIEENSKLKSRIEKAVEYIKGQKSFETYQHLKKIYDDIDSFEEIWEDYEFDDLLNILNGGDEEC